MSKTAILWMWKRSSKIPMILTVRCKLQEVAALWEKTRVRNIKKEDRGKYEHCTVCKNFDSLFA